MPAAAAEVLDTEGAVVATIENKPGQAGSLALYNYLGQTYGVEALPAGQF